jgi:hypothetical protein
MTMYAHKLNAVVPANHLVAVQLPDDFPPGPVEIIVLATRSLPSIVKLSGVLGTTNAVTAEDPIADALQELRNEREVRVCAEGT